MTDPAKRGRPDAPRGADGRLVPVLGVDARVDLRMTREQRARWKRTADAAGVTLTEWIRTVCDEASGA